VPKPVLNFFETPIISCKKGEIPELMHNILGKLRVQAILLYFSAALCLLSKFVYSVLSVAGRRLI